MQDFKIRLNVIHIVFKFSNKQFFCIFVIEFLDVLETLGVNYVQCRSRILAGRTTA